MALKRMDNVGIVVDDLEGTIDFFRELGLELEGRATIEGEWAGRVTGLGDQRVEIAMMRTPDGHGRLELSRFLTPPAVADHRNAPVNALGYLRVMFAVDDIDGTLERLRKRGAQLRLTGEKMYVLQGVTADAELSDRVTPSPPRPAAGTAAPQRAGCCGASATSAAPIALSLVVLGVLGPRRRRRQSRQVKEIARRQREARRGRPRSGWGRVRDCD